MMTSTEYTSNRMYHAGKYSHILVVFTGVTWRVRGLIPAGHDIATIRKTYWHLTKDRPIAIIRKGKIYAK